MESLHNYLPKDLVNIVEEYLKDRTNYNKVLEELEIMIIGGLQEFLMDSDDISFCTLGNDPTHAWTDCKCCYFGHEYKGKEYECHTFQTSKIDAPLCYVQHLKSIDTEIQVNKRFFNYLVEYTKCRRQHRKWN